MVMLSAFSLSAAVMALIFFYHPVLLYLEGNKTEATKLILQTVGAFALITAILIATAFAVSIGFF